MRDVAYLHPMFVVATGVIITTRKVNSQLLITDMETARLLVLRFEISAG